jgi:hypothetical protein
MYSRVVSIATAFAVVDTVAWSQQSKLLCGRNNDEHDHSSFQRHDGKV